MSPRWNGLANTSATRHAAQDRHVPLTGDGRSKAPSISALDRVFRDRVLARARPREDGPAAGSWKRTTVGRLCAASCPFTQQGRASRRLRPDFAALSVSASHRGSVIPRVGVSRVPRARGQSQAAICPGLAIAVPQVERPPAGAGVSEHTRERPSSGFVTRGSTPRARRRASVRAA